MPAAVNESHVTRLLAVREIGPTNTSSFLVRNNITGIADVYGADRCDNIAHITDRYRIARSVSRKGKCRQVGYMNKSVPEVRFNPEVS